MNRVNRMPIRVKCNYTIEDNRWRGEKIEQWKEFDLYSQDELEWLLREHPGCVYELEMTEKDWVELATNEALKCKEKISRLEKSTGKQFSSSYTSVIPWNGEDKVDGHGYGGGLPDAYRKVAGLKRDVLKFESKSPKLDVVPGMPIRIVCTKLIQDDTLRDKEIQPGTILNLNHFDFEFFLENYSGHFQEIEMSKEDWIELATKEAMECSRKIQLLQKVSGKKFESYHISVIPGRGGKVDGSGYGKDGDLGDAYNHLRSLQKDLDKFESEVYQQLDNSKKDRDDL